MDRLYIAYNKTLFQYLHSFTPSALPDQPWILLSRRFTLCKLSVVVIA